MGLSKTSTRLKPPWEVSRCREPGNIRACLRPLYSDILTRTKSGPAAANRTTAAASRRAGFLLPSKKAPARPPIDMTNTAVSAPSFAMSASESTEPAPAPRRSAPYIRADLWL